MKSRRSDAARPVTIDGFELGERIGSGGFSVVYRARQQSMNRDVAIKVLNTGFATRRRAAHVRARVPGARALCRTTRTSSPCSTPRSPTTAGRAS